MSESTRQRLNQFREIFQQHQATLEQLPAQDRQITQAVLDGESIYEIAQDHQISEAAIWGILDRVRQLATGHAPASRTEVGGFGSDTDPGVSGGYGDTGFGSIGNEPPDPIPEEPEEQTGPAGGE